MYKCQMPCSPFISFTKPLLNYSAFCSILLAITEFYKIHFRKNMNKSTFFKIIKITAPVFFGYIAIGIPFGLMVVKAGYPWWLSPIMSALMYAGAGQYIAIGLFATGAPLAAIAITELMVNIRHIVYGLSLITKFKDVGKIKPYLVFALTDETYALMTTVPVPPETKPSTFYGTIAVLNQLYWVTGGIIGALAGTLIPFDFAGVDFALTSLFAVLLIEQIKSSKDFVPPVIGAVCAIICVILYKMGILPSNNILIVTLIAAIVAIMLFKNPSRTQNEGAAVSKEESK